MQVKDVNERVKQVENITKLMEVSNRLYDATVRTCLASGGGRHEENEERRDREKR